MTSSKKYQKKIKIFSHFGSSLVDYRGKGYLCSESGQRFYCGFALAQFSDGRVLLYCQSVRIFPFLFHETLIRFSGQISTGQEVSIDGPLHCIDGSFGGKINQMCFLVQTAIIQQDTGRTHHHLRYGITNFKFFPHPPLDISLPDPIGTIHIRPIHNYIERTNRLRLIRHIDVTCDLIIRIQPNIDVQQYNIAVSTICYLLSIIQGSKVQWIYHHIYDEAGQVMTSLLASHITKSYGTLSLIDRNDIDNTRLFLESTYPNFNILRDLYQLEKGVIDAYLDAKAEEDYLETRGAKLVVAMEMLKDVFVHSSNGVVSEFIMDPDYFQSLIPKIQEAIKDALKNENISKEKKNVLYQANKLKALNRTSFSSLLKKFCKSIGLKIEKQELDLFVACRNSLVHQGKFYCNTATQEEIEQCAPLSNVTTEYLFLLNIIDRVILKMLGYSGKYTDWRIFGKPKEAILE